MLESKLVEPKEAIVGAMGKVKLGGKFYSGTIVAVRSRAEIEQQWKELEGGEDSDSATTQDQGTCTCILQHVYMHIPCILHVHVRFDCCSANYTTLTYWQLKIQKH